MTTPYYGTKTPNFVDITKSDLPVQSSYGIYVGLVRAIDTEFRNGRLYVFIPGFGNDADSFRNWTPVTYASPFLGMTLGQPGNKLNNFETTSQTYGMSMIPPDIGSEVLCCFPGGQRQSSGYWFACINSNISRNMVPGIGALPASNIDPNSVPENIRILVDVNQSYPAAEFNEADRNAFKSDWYKVNKRPLHIPRTLQLWNQGLDADSERGAITSSTQRDAIGAVYGFSTPGRPINDPSKNLQIKRQIQTAQLTDSEAAPYKVTTRLGGHSFLMDDGDFEGKNNLVRMRTSAGHQIIMNDTEGFVYISTASGKSWIELTKEGDILIYNAADIAVRTQGSIMLHADKNIMLDAEKLHLNARKEIKMQSPNISINASQIFNLYGRQLQIKGNSLGLMSSTNMALKSGGSLLLGGNKIYLNSDGASPSVTPPTNLKQYQYKDVKGVSIAIPNLRNYSVDNQPFVNFWQQEQGFSVKSINFKLPTHEPYLRSYKNTNITRKIVSMTPTVSFSGLSNLTNDIDSLATNSKGIAEAIRQPLDQNLKAPLSNFIKQPAAISEIGSLDNNSVQAYLAQLGYSQSTGDYASFDNMGVGKYRLTGDQLVSLQYLKEGSGTGLSDLQNPSNWIGGDNKPSSLDEFLSVDTTQEKAAQDITNQNYSLLKEKGLITDDMSKEAVAGYLNATHKFGLARVETWNQTGNDPIVSKSFNLGRYSQTQTELVSSSNESKI